MLTRWDPFAEISRLQDQFARWAGREAFGDTFSPATDIYEDKDAIVVKAEVPGIEPDQVKVSVEDHVLTITGERKLEHADEHEGFHRIERAYGKFSRSFTLPNNVDNEHVEAQVNDGVLTVRAPKRAAPEAKRIEIKSSGTRRAGSSATKSEPKTETKSEKTS